jgi:uncharacterized protein YcfJ
MNKILLSILICSSFVFAKERTSYEHVYVDHSEPVYEYKSNRHHDNYDRNDRYNHRNDNRYRNDYRDDRYNESNNERNYNSNTNTIGLDTIVGGTIGVIIGNQVGKGNGRTAAKIVGGVLGAAIANSSRQPNYDNNYQNSRDYRYKSDFKDNRNRYYNNRKSRIIVGYKNFFSYEGRKHFKITNRPKKRIRITKTIRF